MRLPLRGLATLSEHLDASAGGGRMSARRKQAGDPSAAGRRPTDGADRGRPGGWVLGGVVFVAMAMVLVGFFQIGGGLSALFQKELHLNYPDLLFPFDLTVWGVVHLVIGVLLIAAGLAVRT